MIVRDMWANISIVMVIEMDLRVFVMWLQMHIMGFSVVFNFMNSVKWVRIMIP